MTELPAQKGTGIPWTDTIPEPRAIAVDWSRKLLAVSLPGDTARVVLYRKGNRDPARSLRGVPAPATHLAFDRAKLLVAGAGYFDAREVPGGERTAFFSWEPGWAPVDLLGGSGRATLLLRDRLVVLADRPEFRPLPSPGDPVALFARDGAVGVLLVREGALWAARPGETDVRVAELLAGEKVLGAVYAPGGGLLALSVHAEPGLPPKRRTRLEVLDPSTGRVEKRFRSGRAGRGGEILEDPFGAAFDPSGTRIGMVWRLARTQVWYTPDWSLAAAH
jgi:hypothetical protein